MTEKSRCTAADLVSGSVMNRGKSSWYYLLDLSSVQYIREVIIEIRKNPEAKLNFVADAIKRELDLNVSVPTIARTLREMIRNAEKKEN